MALPEQFDSLDQVPEPFREMYEFVNGTSGVVRLSDQYTDIDKLNNVLSNEKAERAARQRRIDQMQGELKGYQDKMAGFDGIDPDKAREAMGELEALRAQKDQLEQERLLSEGKHAEAAEMKYRNAIADLEHRLEAANQASQQKDSRYESLMSKHAELSINERLANELHKQHVRDELVDHLVGSLAKPWRIEGDDMKPNAYEGEMPLYGKDQERISMEEYVANFVSSSPWSLKESVGSGSVQNGHLDSSGTWTIPGEQVGNLADYEQVRDRVMSGEVNIAMPNG